MPRSMGHGRRSGSSHRESLPVLSASSQARSQLAEQALADDLEACSGDENDGVNTERSPSDPGHNHHDDGQPMFHRFSGVAYGAARPVFNLDPEDESALTPEERKQSRDAERSLLRDNHLLPPKHPAEHKSQSLAARIYRWLFSTKLPAPPRDEESAATEASPLLGTRAVGAAAGPARVARRGSGGSSSVGLDETWEQAVASGNIRTTWQRETKTISQYSGPLIITFFLQYSINIASIFAVGRIGTIQLGAVSLANMSVAITCLAPIQGLATCLDTLCAQAYGSGHKHLVGLQLQRMIVFLSTLIIPIALLWWFSEPVLLGLIPEAEAARLTSQYLRVMIFGIPGIILFETGKRFTQAQGLFRATTYVLLIVAPFNAFLNWFLVWRLDMGFIGAPIAVAITENMLPVFLFLYVYFIDGYECWGGFSRRAFSNWWVMIRLALPGMIMIEAEWLAFEIMTLFASRFGAEYLAAQSVLVTVSSITYQIPFPVSIAASTRVANLIGAGLVDAAKTAARVAVGLSCIIGLVNLALLSSLRFKLPLLFTSDEEVIALVASVLPLIGGLQLFDALSVGAHGLLRGIGKQSIGGPANLFAYYVVSLPIGLGLAFGLTWKLHGLWVGGTIGLAVVSLVEYTYLLMTNWQRAAEEAAARNEAG